jgi:hypothetical protein
MDETTTPPVDPQAGGTGDPQPVAATQTTTDPHAGDDEQPLSLSEARKIRSESTNLRQRLKDAEKLAAELKAFKEQTEAAQLSDQEKQTLAQKKLEQQLAEHQSSNSELARQLLEARINNEVFKQASKLNIIDIDAASKLIDGSRIDYDESGNPTNIDALLKDLTKQRPWLVGKASPGNSGGATNPSRSQTSGPQQITKEYVQQIMAGPKADYDALPPELKQRISSAIKGGILNRR